jgi:hypothetical protein
MNKLYSILLLLFISFVTYAQPYETNPDFNRTRNWHFGHGVGLRFDPDTIYEVQSSIHTDEAAAVHTDVEGNLLLYSNGEKIWNANHQIIHNGNLSLGHNSSGMGSVFVFHEDNPDYVYLFNTNFNGSAEKEFSYNLLIKEADTFRVVFKDSVIHSNLCEPITVVKSDNGKDIWLVVHLNNENTILSYRLTDKGLVLCPIMSKSLITPTGSLQALYFDMVFSSDGKYMIRTITNLPPPIINKVIEIYEFDNSNGTFKFLYSLDNFLRPYMGLGFSKNNKNIYLVERDSGLNIFEFNPHDSLSTINSLKKLHTGGFKFQLQNLTYGDHIAWSVSDSNYLVLIKNSNDIDVVELVKNRIIIDNGLPKYDLPNFNRSYFHTPPINFAMKMNCVLNTIQLHGQDTFQAIFHSWEISKNSSNPITASIKAPLIEFEDTGVYQVRYIASDGNRSDTISKEVTILPNINKDYLGNDTGWCNSIGTPIELQAPTGMHCYEWSTGETSPLVTAEKAGIYIVKITTPNFCVVYDTIKVSIDTVQAVSNNFLGDDKFWCENLDTIVMLVAPDNFLKYIWSNGSKEQEIEIIEEGVYFVEAFKRNQCANGGNLYTYDTVEISLLNAPEKPLLNREQDSLYINFSNNYTYEWYRNNSLINDTASYLILPDTGTYYLKVINSNNCMNYSDTMLVSHLGIDKILNKNVLLFPNPNNGAFVVEIMNGKYSFSIKDITGKSIKEGILLVGVNQIDIMHLSDGIYLFTIHSNEQAITYKIIKQTE